MFAMSGSAEFHDVFLMPAGCADENNHDQGAEIGADEEPEQQSGPEWRHGAVPWSGCAKFVSVKNRAPVIIGFFLHVSAWLDTAKLA